MITLHSDTLHVLGQCRNRAVIWLCHRLVWSLQSRFNFTWYIASLHDLQKLVGMSAVSLLISIFMF